MRWRSARSVAAGNRWLKTQSTKHRKPNLHHQSERGTCRCSSRLEQTAQLRQAARTKGPHVTLAIYQRKKSAVRV